MVKSLGQEAGDSWALNLVGSNRVVTAVPPSEIIQRLKIVTDTRGHRTATFNSKDHQQR